MPLRWTYKNKSRFCKLHAYSMHNIYIQCLFSQNKIAKVPVHIIFSLLCINKRAEKKPNTKKSWAAIHFYLKTIPIKNVSSTLTCIEGIPIEFVFCFVLRFDSAWNVFFSLEWLFGRSFCGCVCVPRKQSMSRGQTRFHILDSMTDIHKFVICFRWEFDRNFTELLKNTKCDSADNVHVTTK